MFTWQNLVGHFAGHDLDGANRNFAFRRQGLVGVDLTRPGEVVHDAWDGSFAIAVREQPGVAATCCAGFTLDACAAVWDDFAADGRLDDPADSHPAAPERALAAAVALTLDLAPGETRRLPFALAWDFPQMQFGAGTRWYRRYTQFCGSSGRGALGLAAEALAHYPAWEAAIDAWQQPILADPARPTWYKTALFNELYWLVDGGTLWENGRVGDPPAPAGLGSFAFLECYDYPFYNTLDVNFYASFALLRLWPELEKRLIRDFARTVPQSDPELVQIEATGQPARRKLPGAVPHDVGGPAEDPLLRVNAYRWQDINLWKDLNSKFVLQLWRDYVVTGDLSLVRDTWPAVVQALDYLRAFDRDGDGLPEHDNLPDQTYDTWSMQGPSAYGGSLWLAALLAAQRLAHVAGDHAAAACYAEWFAAGQGAFEAKLWNGQYYRYDASDNSHSDSIMADQLAGQWYADATGLPDLVPPARVLSALRTIYRHNVQGFAGGQMGAVNGMRPDGLVDESSEQSAEVWTGVTYALAAFMLHRGLSAEAWATAWGAYNVTYNRGYWFRTPEAYDQAGNFRASLYMRPLSIWAIEHALSVGLQFR
jgi:non-lysosomal glucosylceramidase